MSEQNQSMRPGGSPGPADTLQEISDIKRIMERSSRFISLSGLSGIAAGLCALIGAYFANSSIKEIHDYNHEELQLASGPEVLKTRLLIIATLVLVAALILA